MKQNHLQAKHIGLYTEVNHKSEENSFHLSKHIYTIIKIKKRQYSDTKVNQILKDLFMTPFDAVFVYQMRKLFHAVNTLLTSPSSDNRK